MHINKKHSQFELFPGSAEQIVLSEEKPKSLVNFTISLDKILIVSVAVILIMVLSFSLGVEKGKRVGQPFTKARQMRAESTDDFSEQRIDAQGPVIPEETSSSFPEVEAVETLPGAIMAQKDEAQEDLTGIYTIQVASFKKEKYAQQEAETLEKKGYEILVLPKGSHSIVCVGKFVRKMEAKVFSKELKKKYKDCLVRRL